jgi:hypothetical protein
VVGASHTPSSLPARDRVFLAAFFSAFFGIFFFCFFVFFADGGEALVLDGMEGQVAAWAAGLMQGWLISKIWADDVPVDGGDCLDARLSSLHWEWGWDMLEQGAWRDVDDRRDAEWSTWLSLRRGSMQQTVLNCDWVLPTLMVNKNANIAHT